MLRTRRLLVGLLLAGLCALTLPVAALAGGSAGDQQYVDPVKHKTSSSTTTSPSSSGAPSSNTTPSPSTPSAPTTSSTLSATPAASTTTNPVATTAATTSTSTHSSKQLPYTGYDDRAAAALGALLVLGGFALRRRTRRGT
jgi:LPXTG-motif cell wall-anchored protein